MVAFAVDIGWIASSQSKLQAASDAAVLAGAQQLASNFATYSSSAGSAQAGVVSSAETSAKTYAKNFAGYNKAGNVSSLTLADADIEYGYTNSSGSYTKLTTTGTYPNTFKSDPAARRHRTNTAAGLFLRAQRSWACRPRH